MPNPARQRATPPDPEVVGNVLTALGLLSSKSGGDAYRPAAIRAAAAAESLPVPTVPTITLVGPDSIIRGALLDGVAIAVDLQDGADASLADVHVRTLPLDATLVPVAAFALGALLGALVWTWSR